MNWRRVKGLVKKEIAQALKDPSSIITGFVFPLILLFLYGFGVSLDMQGIKVAVAVEDHSPIAERLLQAILATNYFSTDVVSNRREGERLLTDGDIEGLVVIPSTFSRDYLAGERSAEIQVIADGSEPNTAKFVQNYMAGIFANWSRQLAEEGGEELRIPLSIVPRVWYNEELESNNFLIPGSIVIIMTVTGALLTSLVVVREWERGTMEAMISTPMTMEELVVSKFITYLLLAIVAMVLCLIVAKVIFFVPFRGSFFALALSSFSYIFFALGMGLFISITAPDQFAASQIAIVTTYMPSFILSGFIFDISSMPLPLRLVTYLVPASYFVENLKTIFLVGDIWSLLLPNIIAINCFTFLAFLVIRRKCVKRVRG